MKESSADTHTTNSVSPLAKFVTWSLVIFGTIAILFLYLQKPKVPANWQKFSHSNDPYTLWYPPEFQTEPGGIWTMFSPTPNGPFLNYTYFATDQSLEKFVASYTPPNLGEDGQQLPFTSRAPTRLNTLPAYKATIDTSTYYFVAAPHTSGVVVLSYLRPNDQQLTETFERIIATLSVRKF